MFVSHPVHTRKTWSLVTKKSSKWAFFIYVAYRYLSLVLLETNSVIVFLQASPSLTMPRSPESHGSFYSLSDVIPPA